MSNQFPRISTLDEAAKDIIRQIAEEAEHSLPVIDNKTGLNNYYYLANQWWEAGNRAKKTGDIKTAYLNYMKFVTFVLDKIPTHLSYNLGKFADDKTAARAVRILIYFSE